MAHPPSSRSPIPWSEIPDLAVHRLIPEGTQIWNRRDLEVGRRGPFFQVPDRGGPWRIVARHGDRRLHGVIAVIGEGVGRAVVSFGAGRFLLQHDDGPLGSFEVDGKEWMRRPTVPPDNTGVGLLPGPEGGGPQPPIGGPVAPAPTPPPLAAPGVGQPLKLALVVNGGDPASFGQSPLHVIDAANDLLASALLWTVVYGPVNPVVPLGLPVKAVLGAWNPLGLPGPVDGADAMMHANAVAMANHLGGLGYQFELLDNFDGHVTQGPGGPVINHPQATDASIEAAIKQHGRLFSKANPSVTHEYFVYLHGHGYRTLLPDCGGMALYRPTSGSYPLTLTEQMDEISFSLLLGYLCRNLPPNVNVTIFVDSCYSGRFISPAGLQEIALQLAGTTGFRGFKSLNILCSSGATQTSIMGRGITDSSSEDFIDGGQDPTLRDNLRSVLSEGQDQGACWWSSSGAAP